MVALIPSKAFRLKLNVTSSVASYVCIILNRSNIFPLITSTSTSWFMDLDRSSILLSKAFCAGLFLFFLVFSLILANFLSIAIIRFSFSSKGPYNSVTSSMLSCNSASISVSPAAFFFFSAFTFFSL